MTEQKPFNSEGDRSGMTVRERVLDIITRLPDACAVEQAGHLSLEVRKKRFGWFLDDHHGEGRLAINCRSDALNREFVLRAFPDHTYVPKYVGHQGWVGWWVDGGDVDWNAVEDALRTAYRLTAPKTLADLLREGGSAE